MPLLRHCKNIATVVGIDDPQHGDLRHAPGRAFHKSGGAVDQSFVGHVLEQGLELDLCLAR
jgi:hypothetical protein